MLLIEAIDLHKSFGERHAVSAVSLQVQRGEAYGLLGPDGAGKTTTLRLLVGALQTTAGIVRIAGHDLRQQAPQARSHIGYLAQRFSLYGDLTVAENLRFFGQVRNVPHDHLQQRASELLSFVGLQGFEQRLAAQLSGGMKQKLGLACALIHRPDVLLLDEPTAGVDPLTRQNFWQLIIRLLGDGLAVVVSTPYMDEAARCSRIGFLYGGRMLAEGTPRGLASRLQGRVLELFAQPQVAARQLCLRDPLVEDVVTFGDRLHIRIRPDGDLQALIERLREALQQQQIAVQRIQPISPGLEDLFLALLQEAEHRHA